ncbi:MAG: FIG01269488: protein, clustered with ribosomal protein L32p, partial [uncultured Solirubrobacteraceae bacterium]
APSRRLLRSRPAGAELGRGAPPRAPRGGGSVLLRRAALRGDPQSDSGGPRRLAHDEQRVGAEAALRGRGGGTVHALPGSRRAPVRGRLARDRAARRRRRALLAVRDRRRARHQRVGARRPGAGHARADHLPARLRRPVRAVRRQPQRRSRARARGGAGQALGEALGDQVRV